MKLQALVHSDQIVAALAKMPVSTFGSYCTKDVAIVLASHMNKAGDWVAWPKVRTIAEAVGCTIRTVRTALRRLEQLRVITTTFRPNTKVSHSNETSLYKLGEAIRSLFAQSFRSGGSADPGKYLKTSEQRKLNKDRARASLNFGLFDQERASRTPEEWEERKQEGVAHTKGTLQRLIDRLGGR